MAFPTRPSWPRAWLRISSETVLCRRLRKCLRVGTRCPSIYIQIGKPNDSLVVLRLVQRGGGEEIPTEVVPDRPVILHIVTCCRSKCRRHGTAVASVQTPEEAPCSLPCISGFVCH